MVRASGETQPLLGFIHSLPPASLNLGFPAPLRSSRQCGPPACPPRSICKRRMAPHQSTASCGPGRAWPADTGSDSKSEGLGVGGSRLRGQAERLHLAPPRSGQVLPPCLVQVPGSRVASASPVKSGSSPERLCLALQGVLESLSDGRGNGKS